VGRPQAAADSRADWRHGQRGLKRESHVPCHARPALLINSLFTRS
jgi:hypothetical protein